MIFGIALDVKCVLKSLVVSHPKWPYKLMKTNLSEHFVKQIVLNLVKEDTLVMVSALGVLESKLSGLLLNNQHTFSTNGYRRQTQSVVQLPCFLPAFSDCWPQLYPGQSWAVAYPAWFVCCASHHPVSAALLLSRKPQIPLHQVGWRSQSKEK